MEMSNLLPLIPILAFLASHELTRRWIRVSKSRGIVAKDIHKAEEREVADQGALPAAFISTMATLIIAGLSNRLDFIAIAAVSMISLLVGMTDDLIRLSALEKVFLGAMPFLSIGSIIASSTSGLPIPRGVLPIMAALVGAFSSNGVNILAGFNGLEAGLSIIVGSFISVHLALSGDTASLFVTTSFLAAYLAFLIFNFYPAKAFPGNGGTFHMGAFLASVALARGLVLPFLVMMMPHAVDFFLKMASWGKAKRKGASSISETGHLVPPSHYSLVSMLLRAKKMKELELVLLLYLFEGLLGLATLVPLLVDLPA